jgi:hypothetical protein
MKTTVFAAIALAIVLVACKRESTQAVAQKSDESTNAVMQESTVVVFPEGGVSIDVGGGWKRVDIDPGLPVCPPELVGPSGMVRALLFAPFISDMRAATNAVWVRYNKSPGAVKSSFRQENFTSDSGLQGEHVSYHAQQPERDGTVTKLQLHSFIVQRQDGRFITISYITTEQIDSSGVCQMIQKSLKLQ